MQKETLKQFNSIFVFILIFSIFSASFILFFFLMYCLGVYGTKGFKLYPPGISFVKSGLSHTSGKIIIISSYFAVVFLALFWAFGTFLFLLSAVPSQLCLAADDGSLFAATIDHPSVRNAYKWYSMFSSKEFNTSFVSNIIMCNKDLSYFSAMENFKVNKSLFEDVKNTVNTDNIRAEVTNVIQNLTYINIVESEKTAFNTHGILDIDLRTFFDSLRNFLLVITNTNSLKILTRIQNHPRSSKNLRDAARNALIMYETFTDGLSSLVDEEKALNSTSKSSRKFLALAQLSFDSFIISAESFDTFLKKNGADEYMLILNSTITQYIDNCFYSFDSSVKTFRNSLSFCSELLCHYKFLLYIVCERALYPISLCWLGSSFVNVFFLLSVFLCLYSVTSFLKLPPVKPPEIPLTVLAEDLPSTSEVKENMSHVIKTAIDISTTTGENSITKINKANTSDPDNHFLGVNKESSSVVRSQRIFVDTSPNYIQDAKDSESDDPVQIKSLKSLPLMRREFVAENSEGRGERRPEFGEETPKRVSPPLDSVRVGRKNVTFKESRSVEDLKEQIKTLNSAPSMKSGSKSEKFKRGARSPKVEESTERVSQSLQNTGAIKKTVTSEEDKSVEDILKEKFRKKSS